MMTRATSNVADYLLEGKPDQRIALRLLGEERTYGDLRRAARAFAGQLNELGCRKGNRVLLAAENSFFWVGAYLGILRAGMVCVPLPTTISPEDLAHVFAVTEPKAIVAQARFALKHGALLQGHHLITDQSVASRFLPDLLSNAVFAELISTAEKAQSSAVTVDADDLAALMFTSGSTGRPRGVMVSHRNVTANTESIISYLNLTKNDRIMTVLPFHYCFGASLLHTHLRVGGSLVVDSRFMYPEAILQRMLETECTGFAGVPSHFQILLRNSSMTKRAFPKLRYVQQAGGHLAPVFIQELKQTLPETQIFIMYGQTEATARLSYLPPEFLDSKPKSIGKGIPGVALSVIDDAGENVRPGELGEIVAEGENVALGYWHEPGETANTFRNGRLHTGDLATIDDDGFIYVIDRARDFLKCGGKRIGCQQVEDQLKEFECLLDAAVLGTPDEVLGEAIEAFLVARMPDCPAFEECFRAFCKRQMPAQLIPRKLALLPSLPKNNYGKVLKQKLRIL